MGAIATPAVYQDEGRARRSNGLIRNVSSIERAGEGHHRLGHLFGGGTGPTSMPSYDARPRRSASA